MPSPHRIRHADRIMLAALEQVRPPQKHWSDLEHEFFMRFCQIAPHAPRPEHDEGGVVPKRKFRCDFVWRAERVVVELEGGAFTRGRHTRGVGYEADCEKYNQLTLHGWHLLRFTRGMLRRDPVGCINAVLILLNRKEKQ